MDIISVVILALISESVWETLKMIWQKGKLSVDRLGALVVGLVLACVTQLDLLMAVGLPSKVPFAGVVLTGILISRGANFAHDLIQSIDNLLQKTKIPRIIDNKKDISI